MGDYNLGNYKLDFVSSSQLHICTIRITNWLAGLLVCCTNSGMWTKEINICVDMAVSLTSRLKHQEGTNFAVLTLETAG